MSDLIKNLKGIAEIKDNIGKKIAFKASLERIQELETLLKHQAHNREFWENKAEQFYKQLADSVPKSEIEKLKTNWENEDGNHCSNWDFVIDLEKLLQPKGESDERE